MGSSLIAGLKGFLFEVLGVRAASSLRVRAFTNLLRQVGHPHQVFFLSYFLIVGLL
jgi:hypothetical protein